MTCTVRSSSKPFAIKNRDGGDRREHLRPGSIRAREWRLPYSDIDRSITVNCVCAKLRSKKGAQEESARNRPLGVPYPMRTKEIDGGARERSREEENEGISGLGDETTSRTTGLVDLASGSGTEPASDMA